MKLRVLFDKDTAVNVAEHFESTGMLAAAVQMWRGLRTVDPYDRVAREKLGDLLFDVHQAKYAVGSLERSHFLLRVIGESFPTKKLTCAYFENLRCLLASRARSRLQGLVILGIGSGRCGSTTLAAAFAATEDACATHENPPLIYWEPLEEQLRFHMDRFRLLASHYSVVFDASHWWLNALKRFFAEFPDGKVVGLHRDTESCVTSFLRIKGRGRGTINHWAPPDNGYWRPAPWDPVYPSFPVPADLVADVDAAKAAMIRRYVTEYNQELESLAKTYPQQMVLLRTEEISDGDAISRVSQALGVSLTVPKSRLNASSISDGVEDKLKL